MRCQPWMSLLAYEAHVRHVADRRREDAAAERLVSRRCRLLAELRLAVLLDLEGFLAANRDTPQILVTCDNGQTAQGFVVSRSDQGTVTRRLAVELRAGTLDCRYSAHGCRGGASDPWNLTIQMPSDSGSFSRWQEGIEQRFASVDTMSAFILAPMLGES
jgi:hypothetical protein